ncbi:uncharacterized protein LOC141892706 [Acropora palmata]|uniref:uncharacterized protein LOC141892706 n=1 Tax=Acropora palmata TaxID=6131 RepID=UPI003DA0481A
MDFNVWNSFWATCYGVMAFLIIVGNSLTIATLLRKKFRKRPQFLLISLAFADLLVGCATTLVSPIPTPLGNRFVVKLLQYSNSFVNFVIYILRLPSYRKALFSLCRF